MIIVLVFILIAFLGVTVKQFSTFKKIRDISIDISTLTEIQKTAEKLRFYHLQERLFFMTIIAPTTEEKNSSCWEKHLELQKDYIASYNTFMNLLKAAKENSFLKDEIKILENITSNSHSFFINKLNPAIERVNDFSNKKIKLYSNYQTNINEINRLENLINNINMKITDEAISVDNEFVSQFQISLKILDNRRHEIKSLQKREQIITLVLVFVIIVILASLIILIMNSILSPLKKLTDAINDFSKGRIDINLDYGKSDEVGSIFKALDTYKENLKKISFFAHKIGNEEYDEEFVALSEDDELGHALLSMRDKLKKAKEDQLIQKENEKRTNWSTEGIALFSQILRRNNDDLYELSYSLLSNLVKYVSSQLGAIYFLDDQNNSFLEQTAAFAFNRKKHFTNRIEVGEGLVGNCFLEKKTIYLMEIPEGYLRITSGLGDAQPNVLLLVPMIYNDEIHGVIELASFNEFDETQIDFIEKVGELTAATLLNIRMNMQTKRLLEETKQQAERVHQQEEEMRQSLEEMRATQEEAERREQELKRKLEEYENN